MYIFPSVTAIYCLCEILLLLENLNTDCLSVESLNLDRLGCQCNSYIFIYILTMNNSLM